MVDTMEIILVPIEGRNWRVYGLVGTGVTDFTIQVKAAESIYKNGVIRIPAGFVCDLNSMPRMVWWASTPSDYAIAGAVHDFLYDQQAPREIADAVYREILIATGMHGFRANARYRVLRAVGFIAYNKHAKPKPPVPVGTPHTDELPSVTAPMTKAIGL